MLNIVHWLLPKEEKFFDMLKEQSVNVADAAKKFKYLIDNYDSLDDSQKNDFVKRIKDVESKADDLTHKIIGTLDKTFITPIDKEDIHRLSMILDDIIDLIYATAKRLIIFKIKTIDSYIKSLADIVAKIIEKIGIGLSEVSKLRNMREFYVDAHTLENNADDLYHGALENLFNKKDPIEIIKYREIYEYLENITDKCEDVANVIESIVVKHA